MSPHSQISELPKPGQVVHVDFRQQKPSAKPDARRPLRLVQWNIERGYQLQLVIQHLRALDADIISLQEVDWGCERSGYVDTGAAIAEALGLNYLFLCEFKEIHSPLRDARSQGGGVHGNAILSKFDFLNWDIIAHSHHPIDWQLPPASQPHPLAAKEPRRGSRLSLAADVDTPQGSLRVYCCHLEVFCGVLARVWQFSDILADARRRQQQGQQHIQEQQQQQRIQQYDQQQQQYQEIGQHSLGQPHETQPCQAGLPQQPTLPQAPPQPQQALDQQQNQTSQQQQQQQRQQQQQQQQQQQPCHQVILGDLNTMGHGVARLSPNYCCDRMRWGSVGSSEAAWWQRYVLAVTDPSPINKYLVKLGLPAAVAEAAVNPGFIDPFDVIRDATLDNPKYRFGPLHLMRGKLDWVLLRGCRVVGKAMGNDDYRASDHKWLMVEVMLQ